VLDYIADWTRRDATGVIRLDRLTPADTALLVRRCVGEEREVPQAALDLIVRRSDGIPFLVEELSTALVERGTEDAAQAIPPSFAQSVVDRLTMLGPHAAGILTTASVLGREVDWQLVRDTTGESTATVLDTLARAIERGPVDEPPGAQMRFRHALTAEAIRATLPRPRLIELASRLLDELVRDEVPNDRLAVCAELAVLAERRPEACRHLVAQARNALATGSVSTAIATAERAVQLVPTDSEDALAAELVLLAALDAAGDVVAAMRVGLSVLDRAPDTSAAAEVLLYLARASARRANSACAPWKPTAPTPTPASATNWRSPCGSHSRKPRSPSSTTTKHSRSPPRYCTRPTRRGTRRPRAARSNCSADTTC
jgi:hypothetical protein